KKNCAVSGAASSTSPIIISLVTTIFVAEKLSALLSYFLVYYISHSFHCQGDLVGGIAEGSRAHKVFDGKYPYMLQKKCSQDLILLRIFSLPLQNICSPKTAQNPAANDFSIDFDEESRKKVGTFQADQRQRMRKSTARGLVSSAPFGYTKIARELFTRREKYGMISA
ncbi:MAG: hypothetical protein IJC29_01765, partial [Clostridia bacterium]|nr:hypothetical protein [Clostridia bacterium]